MKKSEINHIYAYIYNNRNRLNQELRQQQSNFRYRDIDVVDCIELACCIERRNTFNEMSADILHLLHLYELEEL